MRRGRNLVAGTYSYSGDHLRTGWHSHDIHQLECALVGLAEVEDHSGHYLLPPQQAAWIPAGVQHLSTLHTAVTTVSVFFDPELVVAAPVDRVRIVAVTPLLREMILHATRWPIDRPRDDATADAFFVALAGVVRETVESESPLRLPNSPDPLVAAAMAVTRDRLRRVTIGEVAGAVGTSPRTLRRHFRVSAGMSWRTYLLHARLLHAMTLLAQPTTTVLDAALSVGFDSPTGFARAFMAHCGETPSAYRSRLIEAQLREG
jgi:AraC-like DNA-binding protein